MIARVARQHRFFKKERSPNLEPRQAESPIMTMNQQRTPAPKTTIGLRAWIWMSFRMWMMSRPSDPQARRVREPAQSMREGGEGHVMRVRG